MEKGGFISALWRYPIKSLQGESLQMLAINKQGIVGDRQYAIYNPDNKIGSGKNTRRFRLIEGLLHLSARTTTEGIIISFPNKEFVPVDSTTIHQTLSHYFKQPLYLKPETNIAHMDDGAIHIITSLNVKKLTTLLPNTSIDMKRFRPNIVLDTDLTDEQLMGKHIQIGSAILEITHLTQRCRMIAMPQAGLPLEQNIMHTVTSHFASHFGLYAKVNQTGCISVFDPVKILT